MLVLFSAGFWLFCWLRLRQTPWDADTSKVPRFFMCVLLNTIEFIGIFWINLISNTMKLKIRKLLQLLLSFCLTGLLAACVTRDLPRYVNYISLRPKYEQPTKENPIPKEAEIIVEYNIAPDGYFTPIVHNRTSKIMILDQTQSFFSNTDGKSISYFDSTVKTTSTTDISSQSKGVSVNLGSVADALGVGGVVGTLANGVNVGGSGTTGDAKTTTTYTADNPRVSVPPMGKAEMSKRYRIAKFEEASNDIRKILYGETAQNTSILGSDFVSQFSICISYSIDGGKTFDNIITDFYIDAYMNVPVKEKKFVKLVDETLHEMEQSKPNMYNAYSWILMFRGYRNDKYINYLNKLTTIWDYQ